MLASGLSSKVTRGKSVNRVNLWMASYLEYLRSLIFMLRLAPLANFHLLFISANFQKCSVDRVSSIYPGLGTRVWHCLSWLCFVDLFLF